MDKLKIAVYAISKDEEKHVERFCKAAAPADLVFVADTGSTDKTVTLLKRNAAMVREISVIPWRFDDARNAALAMLPSDIDVCISLDLDEELQPGWRAEIERVWKPGFTTRLRYGFDWGCGIVFKYEKIHGRRGYRWHHPCHEYPVADRIHEIWAETDMLMVIHKPDPTKSRGQYLNLLKLSIDEDPQCPRNAFYYARELSFHGQHEEAIKQGERYLALPRANWVNERCYAMRVIGKAYSELGNTDEALRWFRRACSEAPHTREPWFDLSMQAYRVGRWAECYGAAMTCLDIKDKEKVYTMDPVVWGYQIHDLAAISAWNLGLQDAAITQGNLAIELAPDDERLKKNMTFYLGEKAA